MSLQGSDLRQRNRSMNEFKERTLAMIKPDAYLHMGKIIDMVEQTGFIIANLKLAKLSASDAEEFYMEHRVKNEIK